MSDVEISTELVELRVNVRGSEPLPHFSWENIKLTANASKVALMSEYLSNIHGVQFTSVFFVKCVDVFVCLLGCV